MDEGTLHTKQQLMEIVQASTEEVEKGLRDLLALEIKGIVSLQQ